MNYYVKISHEIYNYEANMVNNELEMRIFVMKYYY